MKYFKQAFWGFVFAENAVALALFVSLWFDSSSVLYWLMDTKYAVLYVANAGVMLGVSFDFVSQNFRKIKKLLATTRAFHRLRITGSLSKPLYSVKSLREGK